MANIIIQGGTSGTGSTTITAPSTNNTNTVTLPDTTGGSIQVSSNMPAFIAYLASNQNFSQSTWTKVQFVSYLDTNSNFSNTNYRFTPTVAGYYQVNLATGSGVSVNGEILCSIYKNGSAYIFSTDINATAVYGINVSTLIYLNGTTDYIEGYFYNAAVTTYTLPGGSFPNVRCMFSASLVRTA
jgi:hypothetical protein